MAIKTTAELYDEAFNALHSLRTGTQPRVVVDTNGERVEYTAANEARLSKYVDDLARLLGKTLPSRRPAGVIF